MQPGDQADLLLTDHFCYRSGAKKDRVNSEIEERDQKRAECLAKAEWCARGCALRR